MLRSSFTGLNHWFASPVSCSASQAARHLVLLAALALSALAAATEAPSSLNVPPELVSPQDLCQGSGIVCTTGPIGARITALAAEQIAGERLWFNASKSHATSGIAKYTWSLTKPNGSFAQLNSTRNRAIYFDADMSAPFTLTLTVTDKQGNIAEDTLSFTPDLPTPIPLPAFTPTAPPTPVLADETDAIRFLYQATMGPRVEDVDYLVSIGAKAWFEEQLTMEPSGHIEAWAAIAEEFGDIDDTKDANGVELQHEAFMYAALNNADQLRLRMTYALSQLMVISSDFEFGHHDQLLQNYVDVLHDNAFGNYRDLLKKVTLHPAMGMFLAMLGNEKADAERNIRPDENYAREIMQLFTIGLQQLEQDGTARLDSSGEVIQTYWPTDIQNYAAALTGWYFADLESYRFGSSFHSVAYSKRLPPMTAYDNYHQKTQKKLLQNYYVPAGATAEQSLETVLDSLFYHPNLAPFVSLHLIKAFVTSNPSPSYVARVSAVFNNNQDGERGNLGSVLQAVLFDPEARLSIAEQPSTYGRAKDPLLRYINFHRFFRVASYTGGFGYLQRKPSQLFLRAPNVFNFFSPSHVPNATFADLGLVAPELEIITSSTLVGDSNYYYYAHTRARLDFNFPDATDEEKSNWVYYDYGALHNMLKSGDLSAAIDYLDLYLAQGRLSEVYKQSLTERYADELEWANTTTHDRDGGRENHIDSYLQKMIYQIVSSPEYVIQR